MPYELRTFGGLDLRGPDGTAVEPMLAHSKGMALLAVLAVEGREAPVSRSELAALLWPDRSEERAQNALRITLTRIRQDADPELVTGKGEPALRLNPELVQVDLWAFEEVREQGDHQRALELYRGHFLNGFEVADAPAFRRWADEVRERHRDRAYEAALDGGERARMDGDLPAAEAAYRRARELRPLREEGALGLMRVLAERGRPAAALQLYERFDERRREELELPPSDDLEELAERVRAGGLTGRGPAPRTHGVAREAEDEPEETPSTGGVARGPPDAGSDRAPSGRWRLLAPLAVALIALGGWGVWQSRDAGDAGSTPDEEPTVAVLPFTSIGPEEERGVFAEGLHSDLVTRLSGASTLTVISNTSVQRFRDLELALPTIADTLGARWVLEGEVQRVGDRIAVNVQLIDPVTDTHAWAESFRRELTAENYFDLQDEISGRVVEVLEARVGEGLAGRRRPTSDLDAYRFYVRGRSLLEQRDPPQMERSLEYFDQAIAADSTYALAWAGRANALSILARYPGFGADTLLPRAESAVRRALTLEPELAEAHSARGRLHMYGREGPEALRAFRRAIELRPSFAEASAWLAKLQLSLGMPEEALTNAERAAELDPLSAENLGTLAWAWLAAGEPERALEVGRRVSGLKRDAEGPSFYARLALSHLPRLAELRRATEAAGIDPDEAPLLSAQLPAAAGDSSAARAWIARFDEEDATFIVAWMHAALGRPDTALAVFRRHYPTMEKPWDVPYTVYLRYFWPRTLGEVRELPGYDSLLREMNVTWGLNPDGSLPGG